VFRILLFIFAISGPLVAPLGAAICGGTLANLKMLDTGHPVDPCVDTMATVETAASTIATYITTIGLPQNISALILALCFISLLCTRLHSPELLSLPPQTPPPRFAS
jgi:hypothetical protein